MQQFVVRMASDPQIQIAVEGLIGAGKSTFLDYLTTENPDIFVIKEPVCLFTEFEGFNPLDELKRTPFAVQCYMLDTVVKYHADNRNASSGFDIVVSERSVHSPEIFIDVLHSVEMINDFEKSVFHFLCNNKIEMNKNIDGTFFLSPPIDICLQRIKNRARFEENDFITKQYLHALNISYQYHLERQNKPLCYSKFTTDQLSLLREEFLQFVQHVRLQRRKCDSF